MLLLLLLLLPLFCMLGIGFVCSEGQTETNREELICLKNNLTLLPVDPINVVEFVALGGAVATVAWESSGRATPGKQYPSPRDQNILRYMRVASRPKPKKMKIMKPLAIGDQRSKKTEPWAGILMIWYQLGPWILLHEYGCQGSERTMS